MTVLIINTLYYPNRLGGAEKSVQILAEELVKMGHKVIVACLSKSEDKVFIHNMVKVYSLKYKNIYWGFERDSKKRNAISKTIWHLIDTYTNFQRKSISNIIKVENPDIIHVNNICGFSSGLLQTLKGFNVPIIQTLRDYYYLCYKTTCFKQNKCDKLCSFCNLTSKTKMKNLNDNLDYVIGISEFIINKFSKNGLKENIPYSVICNAVDQRKKAVVNKKSNSKITTFGFIGSITKAKGIKDMLETLSQKALNKYNFKVKVAGIGLESYIKELKETYAQVNIEFVGFKESSIFYNDIDALIVPSKWDEPFGRVVIEGAQHNLSVFASKNGALPELKRKLEHVRWFDQNNILDFLKQPELVKHDYDLKEFSSSHIAKCYESLYLKVLNDES